MLLQLNFFLIWWFIVITLNHNALLLLGLIKKPNADYTKAVLKIHYEQTDRNEPVTYVEVAEKEKPISKVSYQRVDPWASFYDW